MTTVRIAYIIPLVMLVGCATTPKIECNKDEITAWLKTNGYTIRHQIQYPAVARRNQQEGQALVTLSVNEDGTVKDSSIKRSSGYPVLDAEALSIKKAKFTSPICGGKNMPMVTDVKVTFSLAE